MAAWKAARTPPRSRAARPRAVVPPGEVTSRRSASVSTPRRAQQLGGAGACVPVDQLRSPAAAGHARGARRRRPAPRRAAPSTRGRRRSSRRRRSSAARARSTTAPTGRSSSRTARAAPRPRRASGSAMRGHAAADLDGQVGLGADDRRVRVGARRRRPAACGRAARRRPSRVPARPRSPPPSSCTGLWARITRSARSASSRFGASASPPSSSASARARPEPESVHSTGSPEPAREGPRHVACADEADLHRVREAYQVPLRTG